MKSSDHFIRESEGNNMEERKFYVENYDELCKIEEQLEDLFNKMVSTSIKETDSTLSAYGTHLSEAWLALYDARKVAEAKIKNDKMVTYIEL